MFGRGWNSEIARQEMARLTAPGVLGFYTHFEATEVFAVLPDDPTPVNVFTILVAEEHLSEVDEKPKYLSERIKLKSPRDWIFGITRYLKPIGDLVPLFDGLCASGEWLPTGEPLRVAARNSLPTQFAPPDSVTNVPLNRILKNNFWNGSHIFEWADPAKTVFKPIFDDPPVLQDLSEAIQAYVPIQLASLSDRLGNIVVQLPVTVVMAKFGEMQASGDAVVTIAWHRKATQGPLRATIESDHDNAISGFNSQSIAAPQALLPMQDGEGWRRGVVWDDQHRVLLAASGSMSSIHTIELRMHIVDPEPRVYAIPDGKGGEKPVRVALTPPPIRNVIGDTSPNPAGDWRQFRMYQEETARLEADRRFKQYRPDVNRQEDLHEEALEDLRFLIRKHGEQGVWLWDPYLSAVDVLETLFHCPFIGAELRALSAGRIPEGSTPVSCIDFVRAKVRDLFASRQNQPTAGQRFVADQRGIFEGLKSNWRGIRLEFRIRTGSAGWPFHDRFLIFPAAERGAQAWSLGTSINGLGKQHHILQRVDDGQRIRDAFEDLWRQLDGDHHRVCKKP
jgi:hypothetical protein